jgi:hypothetical protein
MLHRAVISCSAPVCTATPLLRLFTSCPQRRTAEERVHNARCASVGDKGTGEARRSVASMAALHQGLRRLIGMQSNTRSLVVAA